MVAMGCSKKKKLSAATVLRGKAEKRLQAEAGKRPDAPEAREEDLLRLVHELKVHQIELEMQNAELCRSRDELELSRDKYAELYDFAPIGYITLNEKGLIREANLTAATMLGVERAGLSQRGLSRFINREYLDQWYLHLAALRQQEKKQNCELSMQRGDKSQFFAHLESRRVQKEGDADFCIHTVLTDISLKKQMEAVLLEHSHELSFRNRIAQIFLTSSHDQIFTEVLKVVLEATGSRFGIFGYIDEEGALVVPSMTQEI